MRARSGRLDRFLAVSARVNSFLPTTASSVVDEDVISAVVNELTKNEEDLALESVQVFDAFKLPRLAFDVSLRQYKMYVLALPARPARILPAGPLTRGSRLLPPIRQGACLLPAPPGRRRRQDHPLPPAVRRCRPARRRSCSRLPI